MTACRWRNVADTKSDQDIKLYNIQEVSFELENMNVNVVQTPWNYSALVRKNKEIN